MSELNLGRVVDPVSGAITDTPAGLKANRLVTHMVGVGMTGSGKTGLCITLLEELVLAGVPLIIIDPKGDMANLALLFDDLDPADFGKWVDPGEAERKGRTVAEHADAVAEMWREGLADWGQGPERVKELRERMALTIYTPGSDSGTPVDVLGAFAPPAETILRDPTARRELVTGTVSGLLGLVDVDADPIRDPEHVVLSRIVDAAWDAGEELDVRKLIERLVDPPFDRVGVFSVDEFYPPAQRRKLAMRLNGIVAAPSFEPWTRGAALDIERLTAALPPSRTAPNGRVPVSLFYLAHLSDSERMFFSALLLEQIVAWSRAQTGTSSLRMLVYFDEAFGYLPPYPRNPPTKTPILTLMKQARAVGVGTALVTQNPVDLDYKALSNAGTWFIGRLQTQQDRDRVLDGLLGAGGNTDRASIERLLDGLRTRVFLHHDVKESAPRLIHTRWAMSFLRGPMARRDIEELSRGDRLARSPTLTDHLPADPPRNPAHARLARKVAAAAHGAGSGSAPSASEPRAASAPAAPHMQRPPTAPRHSATPPDPRWRPPLAPDGVPYAFLRPEIALANRLDGLLADLTGAARNDGRLRYSPGLYAEVELRFDSATAGFSARETQHRLWFPLQDDSLPDAPLWPPLGDGDTTATPPDDGFFDALPAFLDESVEFQTHKEALIAELIERQSRRMWVNPALKLFGQPGEERWAFLSRCSVAADRLADEAIAGLRDDYAQRARALEATIRRGYEQVALDHGTASKLDREARQREVLASAAASLDSAFTGGGMPDHVRAAWIAVKAAKTDVQRQNDELIALDSALTADIDRLRARYTPLVAQVQERPIRLDRDDIRFVFFGVLWLPTTRRPL